jgi:hypothetical protein
MLVVYGLTFIKPEGVVRNTIHLQPSSTVEEALPEITQLFEITDQISRIILIAEGQILNSETKFENVSNNIEVALRPEITLQDYPSEN